MMPIKCSNDQNIERVYAKMSEDFSSENNNAKLLLPQINTTNFFENKLIEINKEITAEATTAATTTTITSCDHMYASNNTENGNELVNIIADEDANCQTAESEVKFWKDWLILHLDLIQQQSDEILDKERTILILQQENEMLKERISCMERGAPYQPNNKFYTNHINTTAQFGGVDDNMTQDSDLLEEEDNKNCINLIDLNCENGGNNKSLKLSNYEQNHKNSINNTDNNTIVANCQIDNTILPIITQEQTSLNFKTATNSIIQINNKNCVVNEEIHCVSGSVDKLIKTEEDEDEEDLEDQDSVVVTDCINTSVDNFDFTISSANFDPMRNLRMSIRRKRLSNSSAVSTNETLEDKRSFRRFRKKRKRVVKDAQLLTTPEQYVTQTGDNLGNLCQTEVPVEIPNNTTLEVPRWRVKVYASCYSMEGTENLDDEVYNKRHLRLENDERRRKRWDVQRIREQRVIEKLKQRQERTSSGTRSEDQELVQSLWPKLDDIKYLEVSEQLPVCAFGCPIPKISPSDFALPWLSNPSLLVTKKVPAKRSATRRKRR